MHDERLHATSNQISSRKSLGSEQACRRGWSGGYGRDMEGSHVASANPGSMQQQKTHLLGIATATHTAKHEANPLLRDSVSICVCLGAHASAHLTIHILQEMVVHHPCHKGTHRYTSVLALMSNTSSRRRRCALSTVYL